MFLLETDISPIALAPDRVSLPPISYQPVLTISFQRGKLPILNRSINPFTGIEQTYKPIAKLRRSCPAPKEILLIRRIMTTKPVVSPLRSRHIGSFSWRKIMTDYQTLPKRDPIIAQCQCPQPPQIIQQEMKRVIIITLMIPVPERLTRILLRYQTEPQPIVIFVSVTQTMIKRLTQVATVRIFLQFFLRNLSITLFLLKSPIISDHQFIISISQQVFKREIRLINHLLTNLNKRNQQLDRREIQSRHIL